MLNVRKSVEDCDISSEPVLCFYMIKSRLIREWGDQKLLFEMGKYCAGQHNLIHQCPVNCFSSNFRSDDVQLTGITIG